MTAKEASELTTAALAIDPRALKSLFDHYCNHIRKAASQGKRLVRESSFAVLRMPVSRSLRDAAIRQLVANGFTVRTVDSGHNESDLEISW